MAGRTGFMARCALCATGAAMLARLAVGRRDLGAGDAPRVKVRAVLDNVEVVGRSELEGGRALTLLGSSHLDLRDSDISDGAVLRLVTVLGTCHLELPPGVRLVVLGDVHIGGHDVEAPLVDELDPGVPTLFVEATTWFGGLDIRNGSLSADASGGARSRSV
ncbi:MAG: hypothetical protein KDB21_16025 [Acidimicrobiales bacterium]|nr:hypothetical protein [Acidimicrobiales bacterium]